MYKKLIIMFMTIGLLFSCTIEDLPPISAIEDTWVFAGSNNYIEVLELNKSSYTWYAKYGVNAEKEEGTILEEQQGKFKTNVVVNYGFLSYVLQLTPEESTQQTTYNIEFNPGAESMWIQYGNKKSLFYLKSKYDATIGLVSSDEVEEEVEE